MTPVIEWTLGKQTIYLRVYILSPLLNVAQTPISTKENRIHAQQQFIRFLAISFKDCNLKTNIPCDHRYQIPLQNNKYKAIMM